ncbi:biotin/lipoate--protein ligase family protein [Jhaorihella thermophila]|uniref:Biotin-(Acetyl-CoA carboxylase) ligase n=1 Tax=Jhaorihella thermophila TaxID=488547 RepID=A0A1H5WNW5_9RHOB|nr:biotin/lipoate--protein ligase family protein [Jhaorihella thermophila]SEG00677.1 Biotin-(acetyl-CoA carboxylase) ligase [Jhaorihella thermophila]
MTEAPTFPPLMRGEAVAGRADPFERALALAALGCDGGTVVHNVQADRLRAAIVFAPEVALEDAMAMLPVCGVGFQNALGALAPPEVAVHLTWAGGIRVNGAGCGFLRAAASTRDPAEVPDWLVVGLEVPLLQTEAEPGRRPDMTALYDEGCAEVDPVRLLESWARHTLVWINRWSDEGNAAVHDVWIGLVPNVGEEVQQGGRRGVFLGVDERFGMLIRQGAETHLVPLSTVLEEGP